MERLNCRIHRHLFASHWIRIATIVIHQSSKDISAQAALSSLHMPLPIFLSHHARSTKESVQKLQYCINCNATQRSKGGGGSFPGGVCGTLTTDFPYFQIIALMFMTLQSFSSVFCTSWMAWLYWARPCDTSSCPCSSDNKHKDTTYLWTLL